MTTPVKKLDTSEKYETIPHSRLSYLKRRDLFWDGIKINGRGDEHYLGHVCLGQGGAGELRDLHAKFHMSWKVVLMQCCESEGC